MNKMVSKMSKMSFVCVGALVCCCLFLSAVPLLAAPVVGHGEICREVWHQGTLVFISTGEPGEVSHSYLDVGEGSDADTCLMNPGTCNSLPCATSGDSDYTCLSAPVGDCLFYLESMCTGGQPAVASAYVRKIQAGYSGACSEVREIQVRR